MQTPPTFPAPARPGWFHGYNGAPADDHVGLTCDWAWTRWPASHAQCWTVRQLTDDSRADSWLAGVVDDFGNLVPAVQQPARRFTFDGSTYTEAEMLQANAHDEEVCQFVRSAQPGDRFGELKCVAAAPECAQ